MLLLLLISFVHGSASLKRIKFSTFDTFPRSHKWDLACHRVLLGSNETDTPFIDVDYRTESKNKLVSIQFSTTKRSYDFIRNELCNMAVLSDHGVSGGSDATNRNAQFNCSIAISYQVVDNYDLDALPQQHPELNETNWQKSELTIWHHRFVRSEYAVAPIPSNWTSLYLRFDISRNELLTTTDGSLSLQDFSSSGGNFTVVSVVDLNDRQMYNRSQCMDFNNYVMYQRGYMMHDYTISLIIHFIFLVPVVAMCLLTFVTCRGTLGRRRFPTSIIGSISTLIVFIISLPFDGFVRFYLWKHYLVQNPDLNVWYNYVQVLGIIIPLIVAVTAYSATMVRSFSSFIHTCLIILLTQCMFDTWLRFDICDSNLCIDTCSR